MGMATFSGLGDTAEAGQTAGTCGEHKGTLGSLPAGNEGIRKRVTESEGCTQEGRRCSSPMLCVGTATTY